MTPDLDPFDGRDHSRDVAVYKAVVRFEVEQSKLWLNPAFTGEERERILKSPLRMNFKGTWPPRLTRDLHRNVQLLAYTRFAAGMSVMNRSKPRFTTAEFRESIYNRHPAMDPRMHAADREVYGSYAVSVATSDQGLHTVTIGSNSPSCLPPVSSTLLRYRDVLHELVEADLMETAAALAA